MAATNYTPIQLYYSTTASAAPTAGNLVNGELAINITDGKLYYKDNGGNVQVIATKGAGTIGGSNTQIQFNDGGALAGNAAMVFNKTTNVTTLTTLNLTNALGATYGGTAQSAYAQGDLLYASAVNTLSKLSIGTVNYILTSTGSVPQWVAPTSVTVQTANNLAGGAAGSVPYQSAADTTTFLAIGAANRVMTSTGSAPQWVTSLTGLTGVSSSSMTNTSLTSGRVVYSGASGVQTDSANLTFNGTTLSAGGFSTTGNSTLVKLVTIGDSSFTTGAVLAAATPAKLYIGTGAVTDGTSAGGATNTLGTITAFGQTQVIATNANVTYTNLATLYIAGAPTAGTNVTITNPYSLYIAAGAAYFGGGLTFAGQLNVTDTTDSSSTSTGSIVTAGGVGIAKKLFVGLDANIYGITVGRGNGAVATNTAVGAAALATAATGTRNTAVGYATMTSNTSGGNNTGVGQQALTLNTTGSDNTAVGYASLFLVTTGGQNTAVGVGSLQNNTASNNTAIGYQAATGNTSGTANVAAGYQALTTNSTGSANTAIGNSALANYTASNAVAVGNAALAAVTTGTGNTAVGGAALQSVVTGADNTAVGRSALSNNLGSANTGIGQTALLANTTGVSNTAVGAEALRSNTTASYGTAVGYQAAYSNTTGDLITAFGSGAMFSNTTGSRGHAFGYAALNKNTTGDYNSAFGYASLFNNTTGFRNAAFAYNSLGSNTTGSYNTAVGMDALQSNTTASYNTAVGYQAAYFTTGTANSAFGALVLNQNTTGAGNAAFGTFYQGVINAAMYSNTTGANNSAFGSGALSSNTTGSSNVAMGFAALQANTTASNNTAVGYQAVYANTTGDGNTAVGHSAGFSNTTGRLLTAVGNRALYANTTGRGSVAVGNSALQSNTTGDDNTAIGSYYTSLPPLNLNTTGSFNTGVGGGALSYNTTNSYSTAVGYQAAHQALGANNTAMGFQSLYASSGAADMVAIGYRALFSYTDSSLGSVVAVGSGALLSATNAFASTAVGAGAGRSITTGDRNTLIGQGAGSGLTTGQSNTIIGPRTTGGSEPGALITTGSKNVVIGAYSGNGGGLDIRTANNNIVLSDGDGNPRLYALGAAWTNPGTMTVGGITTYTSYSQSFSLGTTQWIRLCQLGSPGTMRIKYFLGSGNSEEYGEVLINATYITTGNQITVNRQSYNSHLLEVRLVASTGGAPYDVFFNIRSDSLAPSITWTPFDVRANGFSIYNDTTTPGAASSSLVLETGSGTFSNIVATNGLYGAYGGGVQFPATQVASSNANTLDDYEEGSWSPVLASAGGGTVSLGTAARYVKIGRVVMVSLENYAVDTTGLGVGNLTITGFPFSESGSVSPAIAYFQLAGATSASNGALVAYLSNSSVAQLYKSESTGAGINNLTKADVNSSISLRFNGYYFTST